MLPNLCSLQCELPGALERLNERIGRPFESENYTNRVECNPNFLRFQGTRSFFHVTCFAMLLLCYMAFFPNSLAEGEGGVDMLNDIASKYEAYLLRVPPISFECGQRQEGTVRDFSRLEMKYDGINLYYSHVALDSHGTPQITTETVNSPNYGRYYKTAHLPDGNIVVFSYLEEYNYPVVHEHFGMLGILFGRIHVDNQAIYIPEFLRQLKDNFALHKKGDDYVVSVDDSNYSYEFVFHHDFYYLRQMEVKLKESASPKEHHALSFELYSARLVDGVYFPEKIVCTSVFSSDISKQSNLRLVREVVEYNLSNVRREEFSASDFVLSSKIENGTECVMRDVPQIEYIWLDGKVVPKTNEVMLAIARGGHKFMPGPSEPRFWFMAIGITLIVLALGRMAYKHFKNKSGVL